MLGPSPPACVLPPRDASCVCASPQQSEAHLPMRLCPRTAGLYYYSARLAPQAYKGVAGFMTAHCNIMGVLTSVAFIILQLAGLLANIRYAVTFDDTTGARACVGVCACV